MMEQEEHLTEGGQPRFYTRSTARHLRRKRLHDARRAEKQQEYLINGINEKSTQESVTEKNSGQPEVITKSKARRLRKKNRAKWLQNFCSFCKSYCTNSSPVIKPITNPEIITDNETEDERTITKSKARRLRKKNKTKLVQRACSFCSDTYPSSIDPILLKYIKTKDYDSNYCAKLETGIVNNLKQNYNPENIVEAQVCHIQYDKKPERTEQKAENIELQENWPESCLSRQSGPLQFENEVQTYREKYDKSTEDLVFASELKQKIVETIQTRINCTKEEPRLPRFDIKQFNELESSPDLQVLGKPGSFVRPNQDIEYIEREKENNFGVEFANNITSYLNNDLDTETELKLLSDANIQRATLSSANELLKNAKNLQFHDSSEINTLQPFVADDTELSFSNTEAQDTNSTSVVKETVPSANSDTVELEIASLVSNSCSAVTQNCMANSSSLQKQVESAVVKLSLVEDIDRLSGETPSPVENTQPEKSTIVSTKMTNSKANVSEKSRDEIKAEREAKKAAKALAKAKAKTGKNEDKDAPNAKSASSNDSNDSKDKSNEVPETVPKENIEAPNKEPITNKTANTCAKTVAPEAGSEGKSKAELRAERRAKQEAQRAAKQQLLSEKSKTKIKEEDNSSKPVTQVTSVTDTPKKVTTPKKIVQKESKDTSHEINLFKHLYHEREQAIVDVPSINSNIHPAVVRLGTQYASKVIVGSNARCVALLAAVKQLIQDFERPSQADFIRGLKASLQDSVAYLHHCRPLAVSMQNALRHLKWQMTQLPSTLSDADAKNKLSNAIDTYILEQIQLAGKAISITIQTKISNGDVILTYGYSSLINKILLDAHTASKQFRVIVVDGRPWLEGKEQLRRLAKNGIECSYILINALSYVMPEVSKVFLGAHAILANGAVMSRVGTAQVALMARAFNIPVLVACETHKSCERVQTDSIVYNELGNADDLVQDYRNGAKKSLLVNWKTRKSLNLLNITYDVTPADLVTAVVTELAILPCTSVPVILRIKPSEI